MGPSKVSIPCTKFNFFRFSELFNFNHSWKLFNRENGSRSRHACTWSTNSWVTTRRVIHWLSSCSVITRFMWCRWSIRTAMSTHIRWIECGEKTETRVPFRAVLVWISTGTMIMRGWQPARAAPHAVKFMPYDFELRFCNYFHKKSTFNWIQGKFGASELEVQAVQRTLASKKGQWDLLLTFHSYGNYWFTPWGYTPTLPSDYSDLMAKANAAARAIRSVYGRISIF